jgi:hypothetical protein
MKKTFILIALPILGVYSCTNHMEAERLKGMQESLENANKMVAEASKQLCEEVVSRTRDPRCSYLPGIWLPKIDTVRNRTIALISYIDSLKEVLGRTPDNTVPVNQPYDEDNKAAVKRLLEDQGKGVDLYNKLVAFKKEVLNFTTPDVYTGNHIVLADIQSFKAFMDTASPLVKSISGNAESWAKSYFSRTTAPWALAILSKLQNDVLITSERLIGYYNSISTCIIDSFEQFSAIVTQNTHYLKAGDSLMVYAGIGAFTLGAKPTIVINGHVTPPGLDGVSVYTMKAYGQTGKHRIPVKISFYKPDGTKETVEKDLEYVVGE